MYCSISPDNNGNARLAITVVMKANKKAGEGGGGRHGRHHLLWSSFAHIGNWNLYCKKNETSLLEVSNCVDSTYEFVGGDSFNKSIKV